MNHPSIKRLFEVHCNKRLYDRRHLTNKYIPTLFEECIDEVRKFIGNSPVYFIIDESPDIKHRSVVNVLVGALNGTYSKPFLLKVEMFDCSVDNALIAQVLINSCNRLWSGDIHYERVYFIISDAASYMKKAFNDHWKTLFPNSIHITCLAHAIHNLCDTIRTHYDLVNTFVTKVKDLLSHSRSARTSIYEIIGFLPPKAVITRWGTFLEATDYHLTYINQMEQWINSLNDESRSTNELKQLITNENFKLQILGIKKCFFLASIVKMIEKQGLSVQQQLNYIEQIRNNPSLPPWAKQRFEEVLAKNEGLANLKAKLGSLMDVEYNNRVEYLPLVSADVERTFSQYKYILSDRRTSMSEENIEKVNILMFNRFLDTSSDVDAPQAASSSQEMASNVEEMTISSEEDD